MAVWYEIFVEETTKDDDQEVVEVNHFDDFTKALAFMLQEPTMGCEWQYGIQRTSDVTNDYDRTWAYVKDGKLPLLFDDNETKVPERFHKQLLRSLHVHSHR